TRLGVGTNGQMLVANSGATLGVNWATVDATTINLNPSVNTWTTVQLAIAALSAASPSTILTTPGDILGHDATDAARIPVGSNNQTLIADSSQALGLRWAAMTADIINLNPTIGTWTTVQNALSSISTSLTVLARGMAYVGHYNATTGVATFVPALASLDGAI